MVSLRSLPFQDTDGRPSPPTAHGPCLLSVVRTRGSSPLSVLPSSPKDKGTADTGHRGGQNVPHADFEVFLRHRRGTFNPDTLYPPALWFLCLGSEGHLAESLCFLGHIRDSVFTSGLYSVNFQVLIF